MPSESEISKPMALADKDSGIVEGADGHTEKFNDIEQQKTQEGLIKFSRLGWKRLTVLLIVEAIALGSLSLPAAFATLGIVAGVLINVFMGLVAIYTGYLLGQVKIQHPDVHHYADAGRLLLGRMGYEIFSFMFVLQLLFLGASHCLTGATAFLSITENGACSLVFSVISAIILFLLSIPPSFTEVAILGYIDFVSIVAAIGVTIIATGIQKSERSVDLPPIECFAICQFSFMDEMHTPEDYMKSIWSLGIIEITVYTLTGAILYVFVGVDIESPALLSAGKTISKIAFGLALPVIYISGAILIVTAGRFIHGRIYANSITRFINTKKGWLTWLATLLVLNVIGWIIAEAIPFFSDLVALTSALLNSAFTFHLPALMWFFLLRNGGWNMRNLGLGFVNGCIVIVGFVCLGVGTYSSIKSIIDKFQHDDAQTPFTCR